MALPPLYALRAFEIAAKLGSFSQAAAYLHITPSAVSRHIQTLEAWFNCQLFIRQGPKITITPSGQQLAFNLADGFSHLERACDMFSQQHHHLRLKAPSTLTMNWLLAVLQRFRQQFPQPDIQVTSAWMDRDSIDFQREPFDCAVLLGNGMFGPHTESVALFDEWLAPVCAPALLENAQHNLAACPLIHPSVDRRDWLRWTRYSGLHPELSLDSGMVFDTLAQGNLAAISGHGISIGDVLLSEDALSNGLLMLPFDRILATGERYYFVCPQGMLTQPNYRLLYTFLQAQVPQARPGKRRVIPMR